MSPTIHTRNKHFYGQMIGRMGESRHPAEKDNDFKA